jgi:dihydrofolate reductase
VVSTTLANPLPWVKSTVLSGELVESVTELKSMEPERDLVVLGSGVLIGSLMAANLVDEFILLIHPLVLGSGRRLFPDGGPGAEFVLTKAEGTSTGVVICRYRTAAG